MTEALVTVGIDLALRSKHKAVAYKAGEEQARNLRSFSTESNELSGLLAQARAIAGPDSRIEFIMEPTSQAWFPVARWLKANGQQVYLIRPEKVADCRRYLKKHTKTDIIDAKTLAWLGQHDRENFFPARLLSKDQDACFRLCKQRARYAAQVGRIKTRVRDMVELAVPGLYAVLDDPFTSLGRKLLSEYLNPHRTARLGFKRFSKLCRRASRRPVSLEALQKLFQAFLQASELYEQTKELEHFDLDLDLLQDEVADELDQLSFLEAKIKQLDSKIEQLYEQIDPRRY